MLPLRVAGALNKTPILSLWSPELATSLKWWDAQLSGPIATSTMESKYTVLSMALCTDIPMMVVSTSINKGLGLIKNQLLTFKATVHEDNLGALTLATLEPGRHTSRYKFYALQMQWFCSWLKSKEIEIIHCPSKEQKADYLTKPLSQHVWIMPKSFHGMVNITK